MRAEMRALSRELLRAAEEIDRIKAVPLTLVRLPALLFIYFFVVPFSEGLCLCVERTCAPPADPRRRPLRRAPLSR